MKMWRPQFMDSIRSIQWRSTVTQVITLGSILSMALIIWKILVLVTQCESPVVVVLTGSMEPGFQRGDILFLNNRNESPIQSGEIVVFKIEDKEIPIVHRVIKAHRQHNASEFNLLTKGDANPVDDSMGIYAEGQEWLEQHHVMGRVTGYLPYVGYATIIMTEKPLIKVELHAPVIHRVIKVHKRRDTEEINLLTKGDDNPEDDSDGDGTAYGGTPDSLKQHQHVIGRASWYIPYAGRPIILLGINRFAKHYPVFGIAGVLLSLIWMWKQCSC